MGDTAICRDKILTAATKAVAEPTFQVKLKHYNGFLKVGACFIDAAEFESVGSVLVTACRSLI